MRSMTVVARWPSRTRPTTAMCERLSACKVPTLWLVVPSPDAVPMSATGKVDKAALQQLLGARGLHVRK